MYSALIQHLQHADLTQPEHQRIFHGRGHCYEQLAFLNIDWFAPVIWVVIYGEQPAAHRQQLETLLLDWVTALPQVACVMVQQRIKTQITQTCIWGEMPAQCFAQEQNMRFCLNFADNQNIGYFPDAKPARQWLSQQAQDKHILNLFAYTCAFSVAAIKAGAISVINVDMAKSALAIGQRNHSINQCEVEKARFLPYEFFRSTRKLERLGPYDIVIIDPPSRQKGSFEAEKDYPRLVKKLRPMLAANSQIVACLNAPHLHDNFLLALFAEHLPEWHFSQRLTQRPDFPEADTQRSLKMLVFANENA